MSRSTQSYPVTLAEPSSIPSVTDLITSDSAQSRVIVTERPPQLPVFSMATVTTQSEQVKTMRQPYSLITTPSVSWTGQRPPLSCCSRQIVTPAVTFGRDSTSTQSTLVSSSDQGASCFQPFESWDVC